MMAYVEVYESSASGGIPTCALPYPLGNDFVAVAAEGLSFGDLDTHN